MSAQFFAAMHENLKRDYGDGSGIYSDSCLLVALALAKRLKDEGESPRILSIRGKKIDEVGNRASLTPLPYEGRIRWGAHVVCEAAGVVHDPMLDRPLPTADYLAAAFGQPVDITDRSDFLVIEPKGSARND